MAEVALRVKQPIITWNTDTLDDPRSFAIQRSIAQSSVGKRPNDQFTTTVEVFGYATAGTFTIGDETESRVIAMAATGDLSDKILVLTSVASHGGTNLVYTIAKATVTSMPSLGEGFTESRTFTFGFTARSTDGSTDPVVLS
jgi:hypothetical protein